MQWGVLFHKSSNHCKEAEFITRQPFVSDRIKNKTSRDSALTPSHKYLYLTWESYNGTTNVTVQLDQLQTFNMIQFIYLFVSLASEAGVVHVPRNLHVDNSSGSRGSVKGVRTSPPLSADITLFCDVFPNIWLCRPWTPSVPKSWIRPWIRLSVCL